MLSAQVALSTLVVDPLGHERPYALADITHDIMQGYLTLRKPHYAVKAKAAPVVGITSKTVADGNESPMVRRPAVGAKCKGQAIGGASDQLKARGSQLGSGTSAACKLQADPLRAAVTMSTPDAASTRAGARGRASTDHTAWSRKVRPLGAKGEHAVHESRCACSQCGRRTDGPNPVCANCARNDELTSPLKKRRKFSGGGSAVCESSGSTIGASPLQLPMVGARNCSGPIAPIVDPMDDVPCCVCLGREGEDGNEIVFCDGCDLAVHQACYGVASIPSGEWYCDACASRLTGLQCCLCPTNGGALKRAEKGRWAHITCVWWIPEVFFRKPGVMRNVVGVDDIDPRRFDLRCFICKRKDGACIQCGHTVCGVSVHATCAVLAGLHMKMTFDGDGDDEDNLVCTRTFLCRKHAPLEVKAPEVVAPTVRRSVHRAAERIDESEKPAATPETPRLKKAMLRPSKLVALEATLNFDNCAVCGGDESVEHNFIVYCDKCNIGVHQLVRCHRGLDATRFVALCSIVYLSPLCSATAWKSSPTASGSAIAAKAV